MGSAFHQLCPIYSETFTASYGYKAMGNLYLTPSMQKYTLYALADCIDFEMGPILLLQHIRVRLQNPKG